MIRPIRLESSANARFKLWKRLAQEPRAVRKTGRMLLEGLHLMEAPEALDLGVDALMLDERRASREALEAAERLSQRYPAARVFLLSGPLYDEISPVENGVGLMCEAAVPKPPELQALSRATLVYLDGVQDAGNVGTIIRSAAASGVDAVVTGPGTAAVCRNIGAGRYPRLPTVRRRKNIIYMGMDKKRLPKTCPACGSVLRVRSMYCHSCDTQIEGDYPLPPLSRLSDEEQRFVMDFVICSGSLK